MENLGTRIVELDAEESLVFKELQKKKVLELNYLESHLFGRFELNSKKTRKIFIYH